MRLALSLAVLAAPLAAQTTTLVTSNADGNPCNDDTFIPVLSDNGRWLAITSEASDFLPGDLTATDEAFLVDLKKGTRIAIAVNDEGTPSAGGSDAWGLSANGRFAVLDGAATDLVPDDDNGVSDVFVRDIKKGLTRRVSVSSAGEQAGGSSDFPRISGNGRYVTFRSAASDLVEGDTLGHNDIFVHDLKTGATECVSVSTEGTEADGNSERPTISQNGRWVAFVSHAENLVGDDDNGLRDVFVRDRKLGTTTRVSVTESGEQLTATVGSFVAFISGNGRYVAMVTDGSNLDPIDENGVADVYVRDLKKNTMQLISRGFDGSDADAQSASSSDSLGISGNGRWVVFGSDATNLTETGGSVGFDDVYRADRVKGDVTLISVALEGAAADANANECSVSNNGKRVAFSSQAGNLVETALPGPAGSRDIFVRDLKK